MTQTARYTLFLERLVLDRYPGPLVGVLTSIGTSHLDLDTNWHKTWKEIKSKGQSVLSCCRFVVEICGCTVNCCKTQFHKRKSQNIENWSTQEFSENSRNLPHIPKIRGGDNNLLWLCYSCEAHDYALLLLKRMNRNQVSAKFFITPYQKRVNCQKETLWMTHIANLMTSAKSNPRNNWNQRLSTLGLEKMQKNHQFAQISNF